MHRIWSTDWYRNPKAELDRVIAAIERERALRRYETSTVASAPTREANAAIKRATETRGALTAAATSYPSYTQFQFYLRLDGFELHEADPESLVESVGHIVIAESPVHKMEVMRRIIEAAGLKRTGHRIQSTLQAAINLASSKGRVRVAGDFLWDPGMKEPRVRDRSALETNAKKLELVAPEELRAALLAEIRKGFSMSIEDAISNAASALGFQRVTTQAQSVFLEQVRCLIDDGQLKQLGEMLSPNATA